MATERFGSWETWLSEGEDQHIKDTVLEKVYEARSGVQKQVDSRGQFRWNFLIWCPTATLVDAFHY